MAASDAATLCLHASCVAHAGRAVLITGASGRGKSALALQLMALGAGLVSDDRTMLSAAQGVLTASAPPQIEGLIEARGVGILKAAPHGPAPVALWVDLDADETGRLPPMRSRECLGISITLLHNSTSAHFPSAILQYLKAGRQA